MTRSKLIEFRRQVFDQIRRRYQLQIEAAALDGLTMDWLMTCCQVHEAICRESMQQGFDWLEPGERQELLGLVERLDHFLRDKIIDDPEARLILGQIELIAHRKPG